MTSQRRSSPLAIRLCVTTIAPGRPAQSTPAGNSSENGKSSGAGARSSRIRRSSPRLRVKTAPGTVDGCRGRHRDRLLETGSTVQLDEHESFGSVPGQGSGGTVATAVFRSRELHDQQMAAPCGPRRVDPQRDAVGGTVRVHVAGERLPFRPVRRPEPQPGRRRTWPRPVVRRAPVRGSRAWRSPRSRRGSPT